MTKRTQISVTTQRLTNSSNPKPNPFGVTSNPITMQSNPPLRLERSAEGPKPGPAGATKAITSPTTKRRSPKALAQPVRPNPMLRPCKSPKAQSPAQPVRPNPFVQSTGCAPKKRGRLQGGGLSYADGGPGQTPGFQGGVPYRRLPNIKSITLRNMAGSKTNPPYEEPSTGRQDACRAHASQSRAADAARLRAVAVIFAVAGFRGRLECRFVHTGAGKD